MSQTRTFPACFPSHPALIVPEERALPRFLFFFFLFVFIQTLKQQLSTISSPPHLGSLCACERTMWPLPCRLHPASSGQLRRSLRGRKECSSVALHHGSHCAALSGSRDVQGRPHCCVAERQCGECTEQLIVLRIYLSWLMGVEEEFRTCAYVKAEASRFRITPLQPKVLRSKFPWSFIDKTHY